MLKKTVITSVALGLAITGYSVISQAEGPIYGEDGELILDPVIEEGTNLEAVVPQTQSQQLNVPQTFNSVANAPIAPSSVQAPKPEMKPSSLTYLAEKGGSVISAGTAKIKDAKVTYSIGLAQGSWSVQGNNLVFDTSKLDESSTGTYVFEVTFEDGTTDIVDIRVIGKPVVELYWQQNMKVFNKNPISKQHKDLELISNADKVKVLGLTIDGVPVPTAKYIIVGGTVVISKDYLKTLDLSERSRINLVYNNGGVLDFILEIVEEEAQSNAQTPIDC